MQLDRVLSGICWQRRALACECVKGKPYKRNIGSQIKVSKNAGTVDNVRYIQDQWTHRNHTLTRGDSSSLSLLAAASWAFLLASGRPSSTLALDD